MSDKCIQIQIVCGLSELQYFQISMTTWYGKSASKQIQALLQSRPKLQQLLAIPEFIQQVKSYNPKLLDYITNNPWLISEAICYLTVPPLSGDSNDRKYKLPLQVIEMIQTETTCILNGFFKEGDQKEMLNFDLLFSMLEQQEILPLLAGYFFRTNLCLLNNRYKETIERVYSRPKIFQNLIGHSEHMAVSNTIQLFLNLDINKANNSQQDKLGFKLDIIRSIFKRIEEQSRRKGPESAAVVENLCSVLIQTVDKYYLILDGKQMIEAVTEQWPVQIMIGLIKQNNQIAFSAFSFFISLINYYSFSSFHSEEVTNTETARKNAEKLQSQPMITEIVGLFGWAMDRVMACNRMDLYHYKLLEVLCHCISISSTRILRRICETRFFGNLISLLFKHEQFNILHMLIQKSFYHVFISQRKIYEEYKKHLFCELDIIEATVSRILKLFPEHNFLAQAKRKPYFGHFMRILKIYSGIQPTDQKIIAAIKAKTNIWTKISELLIKPYEAVCFKELGSYQNLPNPATQQFTVQSLSSPPPISQNSAAIQQIQKQQQFPLSHPDKKTDKIQENSSHNYLFDYEPAQLNMKIDHLPMLADPSLTSKELSVDLSAKDLKKTESFQQFISKKKVEAQQDIKIKRSMSQQKKLSNNSRGKMTSPSPNKKNSWKQKEEKAQKQDKTIDRSINKEHVNMPKVPIARRAVGPSTYSATERQNRLMNEDRRPPASKSVNMDQIRRIKVIQIDPPKEKKYRRTEEKDKALLQFLGISV